MKRKLLTKNERLRAIDQVHAELATLEESMRGLDIHMAHDHVLEAIHLIDDTIDEAGYLPGGVP